MESIADLLGSVRVQDLLDIALLTGIIYWLLQLIKGTRTIPILLGLSVLVATYILASFLELDAIGWLMENLFSSAVVILVVLFQADIRNALARVGMTTMLRESSSASKRDLIEEVAQAATALAQQGMGATIVMENETGLRNFIERGKAVNAPPSAELLQAIFHKNSPLHDGALIINKEGLIAAAQCILPLTTNRVVKSYYGTRHRSAIGLSEETDAVIVVVSEERQNFSLVYRGEIREALTEQELTYQLTTLLIADNGSHGLTRATPEA